MTHSRRVLVVEDNAINGVLMAHMLRAWGCEVELAADATEAFECLAQQRPRLILLDLQLPDIDGFELLRRLRAQPHTATVIALSANALPGVAAQARAAGFDDYWAKPFDVARLLASFDRLAANPRLFADGTQDTRDTKD